MKIKIIFMLLIVSLFIVSCAPVKDVPETSGEVMKVAQYNWPGQWWIDIADSKGWFAEAGLNVELVDTNADYFASLDDMANGKLDEQGFVLFDLINYRLSDFDLVAVIVSDDSNGIDAIVAKNEIETIADLKGKRIGVGKGTYLDYILEEVLSENKLFDKDIIKVDMLPEETVAAFSKGELDAAVLWEPLVSEIVEQGNHIIWDTSKISGISPSIAVFHQSFINSRPNDIQAFVNVWHKTTKFIKANPDEAFGIIAENYDVSLEEVKAFAEQDKILDLSDNKDAFTYAAGFDSLHGTAKQINNFMKDNGITDRKLDSTEFIDAQFIRGVEE